MNIKQKIFGLSKLLRYPLIKIISSLEIIMWFLKGKTLPLPHSLKVSIISKYAKEFSSKILIETGTYLGQTVEDLESLFDFVYSIELNKNLYAQSKKIFAHNKKVKILHGDSSKVLPKILSQINKPSLFWLDAHYSKGITSKGKKETPVLEELTLISKNKISGHTILIDDARNFNGLNDYPTIKRIKGLVSINFKNHKIIVMDDIIRIYPK